MKNKLSKFSKFVLSFCVAIIFVSSLSFLPQKNSENQNVYAENKTETSNILKDLNNTNMTISASFDLSNIYDIDGENQISTEFCWLFASLKCLETSYMQSLSETYNFSETAMAYLSWLENGGNLNASGNMLKFDSVARKRGLVLENDISNDLLLDLSNENKSNYAHIEEYADFSFMKNTKLVSFGENEYFQSISSKNIKVSLMQKFILKYGALFLAFGNSEGIVYNTGGIPQYCYYDSQPENDNKIYISNHAVCLIGWNAEGFIALNSWGDEKFQTFCIPYNDAQSKLSDLFLTVRGYVVGQTADVTLKTGSDKTMKNCFDFNKKVELTFEVDSKYDLNQARLEVFKGSQNVTQDFQVDFNENVIKLSSKFLSSTNSSGGYVVRFYVGDNKIATKAFVVLSGSEVSSVVLKKYEGLGEYSDDYFAFNNAYLSQNKTTTFLISPNRSYKLDISFAAVSECQQDNLDPLYQRYKDEYGFDKLFQISNIFVQQENSEFVETNLSISKTAIDYSINKFEFSLPKFDGENAIYQNKLLKFEIKVGSTFESGESTTFTFFVFVGDKDGLQTSQNNKIVYNLDGGKNSSDNITSYPNYTTNVNMQSFVLKSPTKTGYEFLGWFLDAGFSNQVIEISNQLNRDIVLYAKWNEPDESKYILTSLEILKVLDYNQTEKSTSYIEYGDTVVFSYKFLPQLELEKNNFRARIVAYYVYKGTTFNFETLNNLQIISKQDQEFKFQIAFPSLESGSYDIFISASIVVNNVLTLEQNHELEFVVNKKEINLTSENLEFVYDGDYHFPNIFASAGEVFEEDLQSFALNFNISNCKNVGVYQVIAYSRSDNYAISSQTEAHQFEILPKKLEVHWTYEELYYTTQKQSPKFKFVGLVGDDYVSVKLKNDNYVLAGSYKAEIDLKTLTNKNYYLDESSFEFEILPAKVTVTFDDITEKLRVAPNHRQQITFSVSGDILSGATAEFKQKIIDELDIKATSEGISSNTFGKFEIDGTTDNQNYELSVVKGVYNLIAPYKVYYKLPNGEIIVEEVLENEQPKGLSREQYYYSIFQKLEYSQSLQGDGTENIYVTVTVKDYTIYVIVGGIVLALVIVYLFVSRKQRRNKVS